MPRGKKICPKCSKELGSPTLECECGYKFSDKEKPTPEKKVHTELGRGRKQCPQCQVIVGARTQICVCGFDFSSVKKEKDSQVQEKKEKKEKKKVFSTRTQAVMDDLKKVEEATPEEVEKTSPREYAEQILSYGPNRAGILLRFSRWWKTWKHVDWAYVAEQLGVEQEKEEEEAVEETVEV